jgi:hypothetical protein
MTLIEALQSIPDYRSARGKRHPLWVVLVMIVMNPGFIPPPCIAAALSEVISFSVSKSTLLKIFLL